MAPFLWGLAQIYPSGQLHIPSGRQAKAGIMKMYKVI